MLTQERLKELLYYDPETGIFTRIGMSTKSQRTDLIGVIAGGPTSDGYKRIAIEGGRYRSHRLAWLYMTSEWPKDEIDHKNRIRTDNRWANIRAATSTLNKQNIGCVNKRSECGLTGVTKLGDRFRAKIGVNGGTVHIGVYDTSEEAHQAYLETKRVLHEGCLI
jgi:hypothetical protein